MTEQQHPMEPSPELVDKFWSLPLSEEERIAAAYRAGADAELEACCGWLDSESLHLDSRYLRADRRPEPPSLAEQALAALQEAAEMADDCPPQGICSDQIDTIRHALERLQELEKGNE